MFRRDNLEFRDQGGGGGVSTLRDLFLMRRGMCVPIFMTLAQTGPEICTFKVFNFIAIVPPMAVSGSNKIEFFLVPPYMPPPSLVRFGGCLL